MIHTFQSGEYINYVPPGFEPPETYDVILRTSFHAVAMPEIRKLLIDVCGLKSGDLIKYEHFQQLLDGEHIKVLRVDGPYLEGDAILKITGMEPGYRIVYVAIV